VSDLRRLGADIRRSIIEQSKRANIGHIGSCLSIADVLAALYGDVLDIPALDHPDRDRFVLSKGHAVLALYAALHRTGWLSEERLDSYCEDGSPVAGHPEHVLEGIEFSTGSLGHGLSLAAGSALAARLAGRTHRTFVLVSDAECNEGSLWEAVMFSAHHRLSSLVAIVDANGQQALGYTADVLDLGPLAERWAAFGWDVHEVDGHDPDDLAKAMRGLDTGDGAPHVLIARTTFGKGVDYMESRIQWHYWTMSDDQYQDALAQVSAQVPAAAGVPPAG
jgi:transketolase